MPSTQRLKASTAFTVNRLVSNSQKEKLALVSEQN